MKILMMITQLEPAGAQKAMLQLAKKMIESGHHVDVVIMYEKVACRHDFEKQYGISLHILKMKNLNFGIFRNSCLFISGILALYKLMQQGNYEVIQTFTHHSNIIGMLLSRFAGIPIRVSNQAVTTDYLPLIVQWLDKVITNSSFTSKMVAVSEATLSDSVRRGGIFPSKIVRIYNAIELSKKPITPYTREMFGLSNTCFVGVVVARMSPIKGHLSLLKMLARYKNKIPNLCLLFLGEGEMRNEIEQAIKSNGLENNVQLLGNRQDVYQILAMANIFILPSYREGLPMSIIEAMLLGVPICASAVDGNVEALAEGRGLSFRPDDLIGMYNCVCKIRDDKKWCEESTRKAKEFAQLEFNLNIHVVKYLSLYSELSQLVHANN